MRPTVDLPPRPLSRRWPGILASIVAHLLLFLGLSLTLRSPDAPPPDQRPTDATDADRQVRMIYLTPPEPSAPAPTVPPTPAPPPQEVTGSPSQRELPPPGPELNQVLSPAPAPETRTTDTANPAERDAPNQPAEGTEDKANALSTDPVAETGSPSPALAGAARPGASIEEEARRIFGRPTTGEGTKNNALPWASDSTCIPEPPRSETANGPVLDSIMGQVLDGRGQPLVGAHLQIVGTTYHGFSGTGGLYRLVFDVALVANCRVQVVRVNAPGYRGRDLYLAMGRGTNDVILQR